METRWDSQICLYDVSLYIEITNYLFAEFNCEGIFGDLSLYAFSQLASWYSQVHLYLIFYGYSVFWIKFWYQSHVLSYIFPMCVFQEMMVNQTDCSHLLICIWETESAVAFVIEFLKYPVSDVMH
jgi:hypothetical protein